MNQTEAAVRLVLKRVLRVVGLTAGGAALISASADRVFAHQFLAEGTTLAIPEMEYNSQLQLMVKPGSDEPVFAYSGKQLRGVANGEYRVAPLVTKTASKVNTTSNCAVTAGGGPNGSGPRSDCDTDTAQD